MTRFMVSCQASHSANAHAYSVRHNAVMAAVLLSHSANAHIHGGMII